ncbi:MAG: BLUF domain-containing protein [Burkholderiaceae bacterium]
MLQISYISKASEPMSADQLLALLMQCRTNNVARGLTGMLLYGNGTFLQVLEGDDAVVDRLVDTIGADPRHVGMKQLFRKTIEERQYADWSMGFERVTDDSLKQIDGLRDFSEGDFNVEYLATRRDVIDTLMDQYRITHWDPLIREIDAKDKVIEHLRRSLVQARSRAELMSLVLESMTSAARQGGLSDEHVRLCESMLGTLGRR